MELRQLRYLLAIAEEGHMGRAADRVHITQPGLSQQLKKLEEELGVRLLERHTRGVRLSVAGAALLPYARNALRLIQDAKAAVADLTQLPQGSVKIGTLQAINVGLLPQIVGTMVSAHPKITVHVQELAAVDIELGVVEGRLDLGIAFLPVAQSPERLETEHLFEEELVLVVRAGNPLADNPTFCFGRLPEIGLSLLPSRYQVRRLLDASLRAHDLSPQVVVEMDTIHSLLAVVRASDLGTILPAMAITKDATDLRCVRLVDPTPTCSVGLIRRKKSFQSSAARAVAEQLRELTAAYTYPGKTKAAG